MAVKIVFCLLGLALAVLGGWMLADPARFQALEAWWKTVGHPKVEWCRSITKLGGVLLLLIGAVLFFVMLFALVLFILY